MAEIKTPQIENLKEITPDSFREYVEYVSQLRHHQRRWFNLRNFDSLAVSKEMEKKLDKLNEMLLDRTPKLF